MDSDRQDLLFDHFTILAESLVNGIDVADLADRVMAASVDLLGVGAAGLLLDNPDAGLQILASSNEEADALEVLEMQGETGPCFVAFTTGEEVIVEDLDAVEDEWPAFVKAARSQGVLVAAGVPLVVGDQRVGALNLFRLRREPFTARDRQLARLLCSVTAVGIMQHKRLQDHEALAEQLRTALDSRVSIEQAKGIIAASVGVSVTTAFELLRSAARASQRPLSELAAQVVGGTITASRLVGLSANRERGDGRRQH